MKVSEYIARILEKMNIEHFFAMPGDYNFPLLDAIVARKKLKSVYCSNELNMAYMADGYARYNGFAAFSTIALVGALSAVNGVAGSFAERVPVLHIAGGPRRIYAIKRRTTHHQLGNSNYTPAVEIYKPITIYSNIVDSATDIPKELNKAISLILRHRKPAYLEVPVDILTEEISPPIIQTPLAMPPGLPSINLIRTLIQKINKAKYPMFIIGSQAHNSNDKKTLKLARKLLNKAKFPVACLSSGKGSISEESSLYVGLYWSTISSPGVLNLVKKSDMIIYLGSPFNDFNTTGYTEKNIFGQTLQIEMDKIVFNGDTYELNYMDKLLEYFIKYVKPNKSLFKYYNKPHPKPDNVNMENKLTAKTLQAICNKHVNSNIDVFIDAGSSWFLGLFLKLVTGTTFHIMYMYASMGWGLPSSCGYALASPSNRQFMLFVGDGASSETIQTISTMIRYKVKGIIVFITNTVYALENAIRGEDVIYNDIAQWDYTKVFEFFDREKTGNTKLFNIFTNQDMNDALEETKKNESLYFLNCNLKRDDVLEQALIWGKALEKRDLTLSLHSIQSKTQKIKPSRKKRNKTKKLR